MLLPRCSLTFSGFIIICFVNRRSFPCIFNFFMFIDCCFESDWHDASFAFSPVTLSKKKITKMLYFLQKCFTFCKPSVTISKVIDNCFTFCKNALLSAKMLYFLQTVGYFSKVIDKSFIFCKPSVTFQK